MPKTPRSVTPPSLDALAAQLDPSLAAFEEAPVTVREFVWSPRYGNQKGHIWLPIVDELEGIFGTDPLGFANQEAVLKWAIGAGKSYLVATAFTYMVYWALNLKDPQHYLGLAPGSTIVFLNQSLNEEQAGRVVFHEVAQRVEQAPWFTTHNYLPDPSKRTELRFPKNIVVFPGNSSLRYPAGYNLLGGVLDEAAWFVEPLMEEDTKEEPAEAIYNSMRRRIRSRFGERGLLLVISNPRHADDFMERLYGFAKFGDPDRNVPSPQRVYASCRALWDTKPGPTRDPHTGEWLPWDKVQFKQVLPKPDGTVETTFEMAVPRVFLPDFQANPEKAKRDLAALASRSGMGYFWDPEVVWRPWRGIGTSGYNPTRTHPFSADNQLDPLLKWHRVDDAVCHAHVDLGLSRDACGIAMGHVASETIIAGEKKPVIYVDFMLEITVPEGQQVDFQQVRQLIYAMRDRGFPVKFVSFDGYQSADSIQQFLKRGIQAEVLSVDADLVAYETFKEAVYEGRLDYYAYRPLYECVKSLVLIRGKKVDHTHSGKKDVSDAVAGLCRTLTERWMVVRKGAAARVMSPIIAGMIHPRRRMGVERSIY